MGEEEKITVPEGQGVPESVRKMIEAGHFMSTPAGVEEIAWVRLSFTRPVGQPNAPTNMGYTTKGFQDLSLPTLLRRAANDIEARLLGQ